jgi:hypothetical protein
MTTQVLEKKEFTLTGLDRCDRCNAQAYMIAMKGTQELMFCAHHGAKNLTALVEAGFSIHDERDALTS